MGEEKPVRNESDRFGLSCYYRTGMGMTTGALMGFFMGASKLAWYPDPYRFDSKNTVVPKALNVQYILRGFKGPMMWTTAVCGVFSMTECLVEQLRDEAKQSTHWNAALAGAASGMVLGSMSGRLDMMASTALGVGLIMGMVEFNGQTYVSDPAHADHKWNDRMPLLETESDTLKALKEKYPEFKHL